MSYKTILVHADNGKYAAGRIEVALGLAARFDAHLIGLYAESSIRAPSYALAEGGQMFMEALLRNERERLAQATETFGALVTRSICSVRSAPRS